jgi:hypothetical protein
MSRADDTADALVKSEKTRRARAGSFALQALPMWPAMGQYLTMPVWAHEWTRIHITVPEHVVTCLQRGWLGRSTAATVESWRGVQEWLESVRAAWPVWECEDDVFNEHMSLDSMPTIPEEEALRHTRRIDMAFCGDAEEDDDVSLGWDVCTATGSCGVIRDMMNLFRALTHPAEGNGAPLRALVLQQSQWWLEFFVRRTWTTEWMGRVTIVCGTLRECVVQGASPEVCEGRKLRVTAWAGTWMDRMPPHVHTYAVLVCASECAMRVWRIVPLERINE